MQYSNSHLVEVNCSFQFPQETTQWDSTFFGRFYEKIKDKGFTEREERKGVEFTFGFRRNSLQLPQTTNVEDQVIFKDNKGRAILMSRNKISFHIIKGYTIWDDFVNLFIKPYSEIYKSLELGNGIRECSLIYLNGFNKTSDLPLSNFFTIVPQHNSSLGTDAGIAIQKVIDNGSNLLIAKFISQPENRSFSVTLECGAINTNMSSKSGSDWIHQANETHAPVNAFFESIITDDLRNIIIKKD